MEQISFCGEFHVAKINKNHHMKERWKHWYCYLKKLMGLDKDDDMFGNNPFVIF